MSRLLFFVFLPASFHHSTFRFRSAFQGDKFDLPGEFRVKPKEVFIETELRKIVVRERRVTVVT